MMKGQDRKEQPSEKLISIVYRHHTAPPPSGKVGLTHIRLSILMKFPNIFCMSSLINAILSIFHLGYLFMQTYIDK